MCGTIHHNMKSVWLFLVWLFVSAECLLEKGDDCFLPTGQNGTCLYIYQCDYALKLLQINQNPGFCGFEGRNPLVCCPKYPGELSEMKCRQYHPVKACMYGAEPSLPKEFTHMALIGFGNRNNTQWLCGGSLISFNFILTAAHCLRSVEYGEAKFVRLGELDIATNRDLAAPQDFEVKKLIAHPEYKVPARYHDIGLIELNRRIVETDFVYMACLDTQRNHVGEKMKVTGWGKTEFLGKPSSHLLKADFNITSHPTCNFTYGGVNPKLLPFGIVDESQICAVGTNQQDACAGDSGGPLQFIDWGRSFCNSIAYRIVGVTSFGKACGLSTAPGVYTRVYNYLSWIEDIVWPSS